MSFKYQVTSGTGLPETLQSSRSNLPSSISIVLFGVDAGIAVNVGAACCWACSCWIVIVSEVIVFCKLEWDVVDEDCWVVRFSTASWLLVTTQPGNAQYN